MSKIPNLEEISIDSCKLTIPLSLVKSYNYQLNREWITVDKETLSEIDSEFKKKRIAYYGKGFTVYASIQENRLISKGYYSDCIVLLINSKHLGSRYFEGITLNTLPIIHNLLVNELKILDCSFDSLLSASITDIDFKKDYLIDFDNYKELIKGCKAMTKPSNNKDKGCRDFTGKTNYGIEWSVRETNKYLTNPYVKIYHKGLELIYNSDEWYDIYLPYLDVSNVMRIEVTIKNKKHLESLKLGLKSFTLREVLKLNQEQMQKIIATCINSHLLPRTKGLSFKTESKMTPTHRIFLNSLIGLTVDSNLSIDRALNLLLNGIENDSSKSNNKKVLKRLYFDHIKGTNYEKKVSQIESIFDSFGWF